VIEEVAVDMEAAVCSDLTPEPLTSHQFNEAPQFWRDYVIRAAAAWEARCA